MRTGLIVIGVFVLIWYVAPFIFKSAVEKDYQDLKHNFNTAHQLYHR